MARILLLRHGHVEGIQPQRFRGRADLRLTDLGIRQAQAVASRIASDPHPILVYTSPMRRCIETGAAIAEACGAKAEILQDLNDIDYGEWQFRTYDEMEREQPQLFAGWFATPHLIRFPGGESLQDLVARAAEAFRFVLKRHSEDTVVLVGHDNLNRSLLLQLLDQPLTAFWSLAQDPCCINTIGARGFDVNVFTVNETQHLANVQG